jgi:hypothetical protein
VCLEEQADVFGEVEAGQVLGRYAPAGGQFDDPRRAAQHFERQLSTPPPRRRNAWRIDVSAAHEH